MTIGTFERLLSMFTTFLVASVAVLAGCQSDPGERARISASTCGGQVSCAASVDRPCTDAGGELVQLREMGKTSDSTYCRIDSALIDSYGWFRARIRHERDRLTDFFTGSVSAGSTCESLGGAIISARPANDPSGGQLTICRFADEAGIDAQSILIGPHAPANQRVAELLLEAELHDDPCAVDALPVCERACGSDYAALCGKPCSSEGESCGNVTGESRSCISGVWACTAPLPIRSGCNRACR